MEADISVAIKLVEWQFKESRSWKTFPPEDNRTIEDAYRAQRKAVIIDHGWNKRYSIDFQRWELRSRGSYERRFDIQRIVNLTPEQKKQKENQELRTDFLRKNKTNALRLFTKYEAEGEEPRTIDTDGVLTMLEELELDPMALEVLVFCFVCDARNQASFSIDEFFLGLAKLNACTVDGLKSSLTRYTKQVMEDPDTFEQLYMYAFAYMREGSNLSREVATAYWELMLPTQRVLHVAEFGEFLQDEKCIKEYAIPRGISKDVWRQMLSFFRELKSDLTGYDTECCPSLADSFVEWLEGQLKNRKTTATTSTSAGGDDDDRDGEW